MRKLLTLILLALTILIVAGCDAQPPANYEPKTSKGFSQATDNIKNKVMIYYIKGDFLVPVTFNIKDKDIPVKVALDMLFAEPPEGFKNELSDVTLRGYEVVGDKAFIDISKDFIESNKIPVRKAQLVYTLTEGMHINQIEITVEGEPYETIEERPPYINIIDNNNSEKMAPSNIDDYITVYYADSDKKYLVPVTIRSDKVKKDEKGNKNYYSDAEDKAVAALLHLLEGPKEIPNLQGIFPQKVKLKKFWIEDGVAYVDVDKKLLLGLINETKYERIAVESIVQTLTSIDGIEKVQFLIDGIKMAYISDHVNISNPIERYVWYNEIK